MSFSSLGLSQQLVDALTAQQFTSPFPIQTAAIPPILAGKDVLGIAQTGSGKTASFVLPILELLQDFPKPKNRHIQGLILVPTRELAIQVSEVVKLFAHELPKRIKSIAVYGGVSINPQMIQLQGAQLVVATPGRLLELVENNALSLSDVHTLVIDEADKMLNLGFEAEMRSILSLLPKTRQNLLFSATLSPNLEALNAIVLREPVVIEVEAETTNVELIQQSAYRVSEERKGPLLRYLIRTKKMEQVLVFTSSIHKADSVVVKLNHNGIQAKAVHSKKSQEARINALKQFKEGKLRVLVATDLMARGIDIQFLPFVINYELPRSPKDYVHRIGRTGRAENSGEALSLISPDEEHHFRVIQKKMKKRVELLDGNEIDLHGF